MMISAIMWKIFVTLCATVTLMVSFNAVVWPHNTEPDWFSYLGGVLLIGIPVSASVGALAYAFGV